MKKIEETALILIDIQQGFQDLDYWGNRNNPNAENQASKLLNHWRKIGWPVFHVKHCSTNPNSILVEGKPGNAIQDCVKPLEGEPVIKKEVNSAFIGTDLQMQLEQQGIHKVVIAGLTTDHCISTSARMAGNLGFETIVVNDATATFDKTGFDGTNFPAEIIHATALASLNEEFAWVMNTDEVLAMFNPDTIR